MMSDNAFALSDPYIKEEINMRIKRGEIYLVNLDKTFGSEQGGFRPVLVIQNNMGNKHSPTTIVACITSQASVKKHLPTHYYMPDSAGLKCTSIVMMEQIKVIDKRKIIKYIGKVSIRYMNLIDRRLMISLGIKPNKTKQGLKYYK